MATSLRPTGFVTRDNPDAAVVLTGADAFALDGAVALELDSTRHMRPWGLSTQATTFNKPTAEQDVSLALTGAQARGLFAQLLGAETDITADGVQARAGQQLYGEINSAQVAVIRREGRKGGRGVGLSVNINGEYVPVSSVEEAQALLKAQAHPKERIKRRKRQKIRILERLRPDIPIPEQVEAIGENFGEIADAAIRNTDVVSAFESAVAEQSIRALGALRLAIENAQEAPEPIFTPPELEITDEERELANGLMSQVGAFDEALGFFLRGISEMERQAYREMDAMMERKRPEYDALAKDRFNEAMRLWGEEVNKRNTDRYNERVAKKRKRFDAFKKVFK